MSFNIEQSTCHGRGFVDADGLLSNFFDWVTRSPVASPVVKSTGGPGWYIHDDQSQVNGDPVPTKEDWLETDFTAGLGASFDTLAEIQAIEDGEFTISIDGTPQDVTGLDFSGDNDWDDVAATIQTGIRAASAGPGDGFDTAIVDAWKMVDKNNANYPDSYPGHNTGQSTTNDMIDGFRFLPGVADMSISSLSSVGGGGTDISGSAFLNMDISGDHTVDPFIVICDNNSPSEFSGHKFIEVGMHSTRAGEIYIRQWMYWNDTIHKGFGLFGYHHLATYDDADFVYDFRGGSQCLMMSARTGVTWNHFIFDEFLTDSTLLEAASKDGNTVAAVAAGATSFDVGVGEGANFTANKFYFLIDLQNSEAVNYVKVSSVSTDTINLDPSCAVHKSCKVGSYLTPYYPRFYTAGDFIYRSTPSYEQNKTSRLALRSERGKEFNINDDNDEDYSSAIADYLFNALYQISPDDEGFYAIQKPLLGEEPDSFTENRFYGTTKNLYFSAEGVMAEMLDGRTVNSDEWIYFDSSEHLFEGADYRLAALIPNTNST